MLAAVSTIPARTTAGIVIPIGPGPRELSDDVRDGRAHRVRGRRRRGEDAHPIRGQLTAMRVDGRALDAGATDVDADGRGGS